MSPYHQPCAPTAGGARRATGIATSSTVRCDASEQHNDRSRIGIPMAPVAHSPIGLS
ncbi:hypothetical protein FHS42_000604 [Streptomyces zagrosensis]|uniref:Uncharacterized protein n=1 Tax=Streptomyces zagrosensis TaxID=1042984 RepID=A0A7W9UWS9_9ACTN|nr:hypothetical protein [Streptomyces zagrosensis]